MGTLGPCRFQIYVDRKTDTPWIIAYEDKNSITGWNELRVKDILIKAPIRNIVDEERREHQGRYKLETVSPCYLSVDEARQATIYGE